MSDFGLLYVGDGRSQRVESVLVNGENVTRLALACDDRRGWALVFTVDAHGKYIHDATQLRRELVVGDVLVTFRPDA